MKSSSIGSVGNYRKKQLFFLFVFRPSSGGVHLTLRITAVKYARAGVVDGVTDFSIEREREKKKEKNRQGRASAHGYYRTSAV